jgi:hypothetical protein
VGGGGVQLASPLDTNGIISRPRRHLTERYPIEQHQQHPPTVGANEGPWSARWTVEGAAQPQTEQLNWLEKEVARVLAIIVVKKARLAEQERRNSEGSDLRPQVH